IRETEEQDAAAAAASVDTAVTMPDTAAPALACGRAPAAPPRTLDQIRADILADTLLTAAPSAHADDDRPTRPGPIRRPVRVTIPLATLAGVSDEPALLDGTGPIDSELARRIAGAAPGWDRVFTDACTGLPVGVDRYRPSAELKRYLHARDERCRFPGCRRAA